MRFFMKKANNSSMPICSTVRIQTFVTFDFGKRAMVL